MKRTQHDTLSRRAMKLLCRLLGLVLAVMLAATCGFQYLLSRFSQKTPGPAPGQVPAIQLSTLSGTPQQSTRRELLNVLLIGQDGREGLTASRSDSMILCSFHRESKTVTMTSFLRDLYVEIPGHGSNRINAAYALGGTSLLEKTLEHNFGLHIDGYVEVDFSQFSGIIDLLGGVELELRQDEAERINRVTGSSLTEGLHSLTGTEALAYARIRDLDLDGDASRTVRQRKVLGALVDAYKDLSVKDLIPMLAKVLPLISTDMNNGQLLLCALEVAPHLSQAAFVSQHVPAPGTYWDETIDGMMVLRTDMAKARESLHQSLLGEK